MISKLKLEINKMLSQNFHEINIYDDVMEQGFTKPCFFVQVLSSKQVKELNRRYKEVIYFDVNYLSNKESINLDYFNMADTLYKTLEYIEIDNKKYRVSNKEHEISEGILHFKFQVKFNLLKIIEEVNMNEMGVDIVGK
ncbi:UNVERIFIED_ORG: hypothetical protein B2H98_16380 [Clostridium botulinum]|uniref:phage tail terminator family protein n=1 Tax=Clostridium botulinum TaxID=1491 RepID=UPI000774127E|nr:hypothetical protein [Clostridium botulinum]MBN1076874.1 hypothetical protein [Clostridium botulinum]NFE74981.1 hypothetical protein [Clostridium botulinum]NFL59379.1 hypothetical protein [Clostridium botulinum]NFL60730.1 hypothetical protein [Clostridium botulinum]NFO10540.1 hypothetical protein [Clostridium botulinum]